MVASSFPILLATLLCKQAIGKVPTTNQYQPEDPSGVDTCSTSEDETSFMQVRSTLTFGLKHVAAAATKSNKEVSNTMGQCQTNKCIACNGVTDTETMVEESVHGAFSRNGNLEQFIGYELNKDYRQTVGPNPDESTKDEWACLETYSWNIPAEFSAQYNVKCGRIRAKTRDTFDSARDRDVCATCICKGILFSPLGDATSISPARAWLAQPEEQAAHHNAQKAQSDADMVDLYQDKTNITKRMAGHTHGLLQLNGSASTKVDAYSQASQRDGIITPTWIDYMLKPETLRQAYCIADTFERQTYILVNSGTRHIYERRIPALPEATRTEVLESIHKWSSWHGCFKIYQEWVRNPQGEELPHSAQCQPEVDKLVRALDVLRGRDQWLNEGVSIYNVFRWMEYKDGDANVPWARIPWSPSNVNIGAAGTGDKIGVGDCVTDPGFFAASPHRQFIQGKAQDEQMHNYNFQLFISGHRGVPVAYPERVLADVDDANSWQGNPYNNRDKPSGQAEILWPPNSLFAVRHVIFRDRKIYAKVYEVDSLSDCPNPDRGVKDVYSGRILQWAEHPNKVTVPFNHDLFSSVYGVPLE